MSPINTPIVEHGVLRYIVHRVEDVTDFAGEARQRSEEREATQELRSRASRLEHELYQRAQELQLANQELRELRAELEGRVAQTTGDLAREADARQRTEMQLRRSEEQLRQAQKLEAVGRLGAGIAHDFNNLLSVVPSYSEEPLSELPEGSDSRRNAAEIHRAGERAAELTRQLLVFSRQQVLAPKILDLNELLTGLGLSTVFGIVKQSRGIGPAPPWRSDLGDLADRDWSGTCPGSGPEETHRPGAPHQPHHAVLIPAARCPDRRNLRRSPLANGR